MREFFPMYCSAAAIRGFEAEKHRAAELLTKHLSGKPGIVLLAMEDPDWIYGQATFPYPAEQEVPLKFLDRFTTLSVSRALDTLATEGRASAILFTDSETKQRFTAHPAFIRVSHLFRLIPDFRAPAPRPGLLSSFKGWLGKSRPIEPEKEIDAIELARNSLRIFTKRIRQGSNLIDTLHFGMGFYHYCSLDKFIEVLRARVAEHPNDANSQAALAVILSDVGDHAAALPQARVAAGLKNAPPEAHLWRAKAAWWLGEWQEGLEAMARVGPPPGHWTVEFRRAVEALRSALLAGNGDLQEAISALNSAHDLDSSRIATHLRLARLQYQAGRPDQSSATLRKARVIDPGEVLVQVELCRALEAAGDEAELAKALRKLPESPRGRFELRRFAGSDTIEGAEPPIPTEFEDFDRHRDRCLTAATLPDWLLLLTGSEWFTLMNLFLSGDHRPETEHACRLSHGFRALRQEPLSGAAAAALGAAWNLSGRSDIAIQWARSGVAFAPDNEMHHWLLAKILQDNDDLDEAYECAEFALMVDQAEEGTLNIVQHLFWTIPRIDRLAASLRLGAQSRQSVRETAETRLDDPVYRPAALFAKALLLIPDDYGEALALQREALGLRPDNDKLHEYHIATLEQAGEVEALEVARGARGAALLRKIPELDAATCAYIADGLIGNGHSEEASKFAYAGKHLDAQLPAVRLVFGKLAILADRIDDAIADLAPLAQSNDALAGPAANHLASALSDADRYEEALVFWQRLRTLEPDAAMAYRRAAFDLWLLDRDAEALSMIEEALLRDQSSGTAWSLKARLLKQVGRPEEALTAFVTALASEDCLKRTRLRYARLLVELGRPDEALADCAAALLKDPASWEAVVGRVEAFKAKEQLDKAEETAIDWVASAQADAEATLEVQLAVYDNVGALAAVRFGELALDLHPDAPGLLADQAINLLNLANMDEAVALAEKALRSTALADSALRQCAYVMAFAEQLDADVATSLVARLLAGKRDAKALRYAANLMRSANLDASELYSEARDAYLAESDRDHGLIGWCMLNLGDFAAAGEAMRCQLAIKPNDAGVVIEAAIIAFFGSDGGEKATDELEAALRTATSLEQADINMKLSARVAKQWSRQGKIASPARLDALELVLSRA